MIAAQRSNAVNSRAKVEKSGWLILKGKKKYFQLKGELLMWFDEDPNVCSAYAYILHTAYVHNEMHAFTHVQLYAL